MKTKLPLILAVAAALGGSFAPAQDVPRPAKPLAPPPPDSPPAPPAPDGRLPRPEWELRGPNNDEQRPGGPPRREGAGPRENDRPRDGERGRDGERSRDGDRPHDRERGPDRDGDRRGDGSNSAARPQKPTPYLGIATGPVPVALGAQVGLAEGFGLLVEQVVPDSPAATAGLQRFDVLKLLGDQQLVDPDQLATLVRGAGKDAEVALTVLRKGAELKLTVKVGERLLPERTAGGRLGDPSWRLEPLRQLPEMARDTSRRGEEMARHFQEQMRGFQERLGDFQKRLLEWQKNPTGTPPEAPKLEMPKPPTPPEAPTAPRPADLLRESRPGGAAQIRVDQDGNVTTWNTAKARIFLKDEQGEIDLRNDQGKRLATVKNAQGEVVFDGPVDTAEQRAALSPDVRRKIELHGVDAMIRAEPRLEARAPEVRETERGLTGERAIQ